MSENLKKLLACVSVLQMRWPQLTLCGSVALMFANLLDERTAGDVDFVLNRKDFDAHKFFALSHDRYPTQDEYDSFHGNIQILDYRFSINLLVFKDEYPINHENISVSGTNVKIQKADDILCWKKKYNREKDRTDLEKISNKLVEKYFLEEK